MSSTGAQGGSSVIRPVFGRRRTGKKHDRPDGSHGQISKNALWTEQIGAHARETLELLSQSTNPDGHPRHRTRAIEHLRGLIASRGYGRRCFELAALVHACAVAGNRRPWLDVFLGITGTADAREALAGIGADHPLLHLDDRGLSVRRPNRKSGGPDLSLSNVHVLVTFLEFTAELIGYDQLLNLLAPLDATTLSHEALSRVATGIRTAISAELDQIGALRRQEHRNFEQIYTFLGKRHGDGLRIDAISDEDVLCFWETANAPDPVIEGDFKSFPRIVSAFANFIQAAEAALVRTRSMQGSGPAVANDRDTFPSEVDAWRADGVDDGDRDPDFNVWDWIAGDEDDPCLMYRDLDPRHVRFLTGVELTLLEDVLSPKTGLLPLSYLRVHASGISGIKEGAVESPDMESFLALLPDTYAGAIDRLVAVSDHLMHILAICWSLTDDSDMARKAPSSAGLADATERLVRHAFRQIDRKGFRAVRNGDRDATDEFRRAGPVLALMREQLRARLDVLSPLANDRETAARDRLRFARTFAIMYGDGR